MVYKIECQNKHIIEVNASELDEILEFNLCPSCDAKLISVDPETIKVGCTMCSWEDSTLWEEVGNYVYTGCPNCGKYIPDSNIHVLGSFFYRIYEYLDHSGAKSTEAQKRKSRPDYWDILIHFCSKDELASILKDNTIRASITGLYSKKAICFTETPIVYSKEIRKRHGDYGIAFEKKQILKNGGQPIIHVTDFLRSEQEKNGGFAKSVKSFLQLISTPQTTNTGKYFNFIHEREWRVATDLDLSKVEPIGIILPEGYDPFKFSGDGWEKLIEAAYKYGEISD